MKIKPFNEKLAQLVRLLSDGQYHDGNVLGETLHVTRSAVWKMIKKKQIAVMLLNEFQRVAEIAPDMGIEGGIRSACPRNAVSFLYFFRKQ